MNTVRHAPLSKQNHVAVQLLPGKLAHTPSCFQKGLITFYIDKCKIMHFTVMRIYKNTVKKSFHIKANTLTTKLSGMLHLPHSSHFTGTND